MIIELDCEFQALRPPIDVRHASSPIASASISAPKRSSTSCLRGARCAVKKSTMMLPRRNWHHGMNSAIAAPAAKPDSSNAPTMLQPVVLRPIRLMQVISVITTSSTPASTAHTFANTSRIFTLPSSGLSVLRFGQLDHQSVQTLVQRDLAAQPAGRLARRGGHLAHLVLLVGRRAQLVVPSRVDDHVAGGAGEAAAAVGHDALDAGIGGGAH